MKRFRVVITLSSGEVIEKITNNPTKILESLSKDYPQRSQYQMLEILGLTALVKGYVVACKTELL